MVSRFEALVGEGEILVDGREGRYEVSAAVDFGKPARSLQPQVGTPYL